MMYNCNIFLFVLVGFFHFFVHFFIYFFIKINKKQDFLQSVSLSQKIRIKYTIINSTNKTKAIMKTLAIIAVVTLLVSNVISMINGIKQGKNIWDF